MKFLKRFLIGAVSLTAVIWLVNTNAFITPPSDHAPRFIAHRGVHQIYAGSDRTADTCTANPVQAATHGLIANTLPSMRAAFAAGADVVEIDVHLTADKQLVVFHDWTLECQTDGTGPTHKRNMDALRQLDLGYGYTVDGTTFPLRGSAVGAMPSLPVVLSADWDGQFLVNFKSDWARDGDALAALSPQDLAQVWGVYGGGAPTQAAMAATSLKGFDRSGLKACLVRYLLIGWTSRVPAACADMVIAVPLDYGPYLWGWPHKFTRRMKAAGTDVILWGPYNGSGFSSGVDDAATLGACLPTLTATFGPTGLS